MKKKKRGSGKVFVGISFGFFSVAIIFLIVGLAYTVKGISEAIVIRDPSAILASEGVVGGRPVVVPVLYRDLDDGNVSQGEELFASKDLDSLTEWFAVMNEAIPGYNSIFRLNYKEDGAEFSFYDDEFYPLDEDTTLSGDVALGDDVTDVDRYNHLFAMSYGVPIAVLSSGDEKYEITADDNTLVFVDDKLVIDIDGADELVTGVLQIHENGEVYVGTKGEAMAYSGVNVVRDKNAVIRVLHLDKNPGSSVFKMKIAGMSPVLSVSDMKYSGDDSVRVAYDPSGPTSITSHGISKIFKASNAKELIVLATVEGTVLVVFLVVAVSIIKKQKKKRL